MALRKGRAVSAAEKPIYEHCTRLFHQGTLDSFHAFEKDDWQIKIIARPTSPSMTLNEVKAALRNLDPDGCTWDTKTTGKTNKAALLNLSKRLLDALTTGDCDERLIIEATALISAA